MIDPQGILQADLPGTKMKRPGPDEILAALQKAKESAPNAN